MRIGIIGSGKIGATLAELLARFGHEVLIANSRGPESLREFAAAHPGVRPSTVEQAAQGSELVVLAIPFGKVHDLPAQAFEGRIVVDANNYYPDRDGAFDALLDGTTSSEILAAHLPGARVVKAFNTIYFEQLRGDGRPGAGEAQRRALPIAGDDPAAKQTVRDLIEQLGFAVVDTGGLADGRRQQPGTPVYNVPVDTVTARTLLDRA